jgi:hypothetical protein
MSSREETLKTVLLVIVISAFALVIGCMNFKTKKLSTGKEQAPQSGDIAKSSAKFTGSALTERRESVAKAVSEKDEIASLNEMALLLAGFVQPDRTKDELVQFLHATGQEPQPFDNGNPYTGAFDIVVTNKKLPGTRYFRAQYRQKPGQEGTYMQSMTFEFRPGPNAMAEAVEAVKQAFAIQEAPFAEREDFVEWKLGGYSLWVYSIDQDDIENSAIHAYSKTDIGVIRVGIQEDISHGHDD